MTVLGLIACRSEDEPQTSEADSADRVMAGDAGMATPASSPAASASLPPPPADPQGCFTALCHQGLLRTSYRHQPFQEGACDACHLPEQDDHMFPIKRPGVEACTFCHPVVGHKKHLHEVIAKEGCLPCHDPHGANTKFLLTGPSTELTCQGCHEIERKPHLHAPFAGGQCTTCHQPHESDNAFLLLGGEGKDHCLVCHRSKQHQLLAATTIHKPIEDGCTGCHEPHSSDHPYALRKPLEKLCFECHPDVEGKVAAARSPHGAVFTGHRCANCHDPHAEGRPALLRADLRTLCLSCHDRPVKAYDGRTIPDMTPSLLGRKLLHGPVREGQCNVCHQVHGANNTRLLTENFPQEFYEAFDLAKYALCFECHTNALVLDEETSTLTDFRNGRRNLHYVHVNRAEKGRTCRTCHEIHGSNLPRHMASEVPFEGGGWAMPIGYEATPDGGRCSPGCHGPQAYGRETPIPVTTTSTGDVP